MHQTHPPPGTSAHNNSVVLTFPLNAMTGTPPDALNVFIDYDKMSSVFQFTYNHGNDNPRSVPAPTACAAQHGHSLAHGLNPAAEAGKTNSCSAAAAPGGGAPAAPRAKNGSERGPSRSSRAPAPRAPELLRHSRAPSEAPRPAARCDPPPPPPKSGQASGSQPRVLAPGPAPASAPRSRGPPESKLDSARGFRETPQPGPSSRPPSRGEVASAPVPTVKVEKVKGRDASVQIIERYEPPLSPSKTKKRKIVKHRHWTTWTTQVTKESMGRPIVEKQPRLGHLYLNQHDGGLRIWMYGEVYGGVIDEATGKKKLGWQVVREGCAHPKLDDYVLQINDDGEPQWVQYRHMQKVIRERKKFRRFNALSAPSRRSK